MKGREREREGREGKGKEREREKERRMGKAEGRKKEDAIPFFRIFWLRPSPLI